MAGLRMTLGVLAVLGAPLDRPDTELYGLEIVRASGLEPGTIYPILQRLRGAGWVSDQWRDPKPAHTEDRPSRRYYRLTVEGRARAIHALQHGRDRSGLSRLLARPHFPYPHYRGKTGMSGHRVLVAGDGEILGGCRDRQAAARFRSGLALGPRSLWWVRSLLLSEERAWWAEVTSLPRPRSRATPPIRAQLSPVGAVGGLAQLDAPGSLCSVGAGGRRVQQCQVEGDKNGES
jgi:hypothetical protein